MFSATFILSLIVQFCPALIAQAERLSDGDTAADTQPKPKDRIAVADFTTTGSVDIPDAGAVVAQLLINEIDPERFQLVERTHLASILAEHDLTMAAIVENPLVLKNRMLAGVRYLVTGSVVKLGYLSVSARLVDVSTGAIIQTAQVDAEDARGLQGAIGNLAASLQMTSAERKAHNDFGSTQSSAAGTTQSSAAALAACENDLVGKWKIDEPGLVRALSKMAGPKAGLLPEDPAIQTACRALAHEALSAHRMALEFKRDHSLIITGVVEGKIGSETGSWSCPEGNLRISQIKDSADTFSYQKPFVIFAVDLPGIGRLGIPLKRETLPAVAPKG
jgi:curli biogenesis system outer membrane secretion channel CsgG